MPFRRVILTTARLRLRPFTAADTSVHRHLYRDPEVTRYLGGGPFLGDEVGRGRDHVARAVGQALRRPQPLSAVGLADRRATTRTRHEAMLPITP